MTEHNFDGMRRAMVASQLRTTGVNNPRVLAAMGAVARERFVPDAYMSAAYADLLVPLDGGRRMNAPMSLGRMLSEANLRGHERALVIGAATGYGAAVLARLAGSVVALEEDAGLAAFARERLAGTGVTLVEGPLNEGWAEGAPYDFILVDGAVEVVPQVIVDQVADGGELAVAVLEGGVAQLSVGRVIGGALGMNAYADAASAALPGFEKPRGFDF
jgi:protein-L-isoaspartate(D-aspartate) O-methyltransferase